VLDPRRDTACQWPRKRRRSAAAGRWLAALTERRGTDAEPRPVSALVFDFDGLICDTETVVFESVQRVFRDHGADLTLEDWLPAVGAATAPDWPAMLTAAVGRPLDHEMLRVARQGHSDELMAVAAVLPGVRALLDAAHAAGVPCGMASNSPRSWVTGNLERLGLAERFDVVIAVDEVRNPKPHPEPYERAVAALGASPPHAVGLEDTVIGVTAARRAGLYTVAVPGPMSAQHDFSAADLVVASLADVTLADLGEGVARRARS
jgi:HAD superfamily hydrolase (TIGR01509 family)